MTEATAPKSSRQPLLLDPSFPYTVRPRSAGPGLIKIFCTRCSSAAYNNGNRNWIQAWHYRRPYVRIGEIKSHTRFATVDYKLTCLVCGHPSTTPYEYRDREPGSPDLRKSITEKD